MKQLLSRHLQPLTERHPALLTMATATAGFLRSIAIKPYRQRHRPRELALWERYHSLHAVRCQVYREKSAGGRPTIVVAGFVPDATEVVEFQRPLLRSHGSIYYLNYPRNGFSHELFEAQLADLIDELSLKGERPVLMGVSFGAGLVVDFLRRASEQLHDRLRGLLLVSPVLCTADLIRPDNQRSGGVRMLESNLRKILKADPEDESDLNRQLERARRCFQALFEAGAENRNLTTRHLAIRQRIFGVLEHTSNLGGYQRVLALRSFAEPAAGRTIFGGPTLIMLAEDEQSILVPGSPTLQLCADHAALRSVFPEARASLIASNNDADPVAHASLIFHQHCYNPRMEQWLQKLHNQPLLAVV
ncbi:alpha/beta hydrolase [Trichlorobacter lovleyi]|uniref:alpha/beta fold hydrolase n=1 Tax=Trichlorobacter lovleyi TaxID=313985 RepID=UPI002240BCD3|nr:alpha/beta hydrolase [Trichlorobacter lovleyi]QOX77843.1 alpha/beta hydrolase [Trichlorobacter lovleyi]